MHLLLTLQVLPSGFGTDKIKKIFSLSQAEGLGITEGDAVFGVLWYHISEAYRANPALVLWVSIQPVPVDWGLHDFVEVHEVQTFSEGEIRQVAVFAEGESYSVGHITAIQAQIDSLRGVNMPLQAIYAADFSATNAAGLAAVDLRSQSDRYVSVCLGEDGAGVGAALAVTKTYSITCIGLELGVMSVAKVNESIGDPNKFPLSNGVEMAQANLATGENIRDIDANILDNLFDAGWTIPRKFVGDAQTYFAGQPTCVALNDDFAFQNLGRTMDKCERGVRIFLDKTLNTQFQINNDGTLSAVGVSFFQDKTEQPLDAMLAAGEISQRKVTIDDTQKPLENDEIVVSFSIIPTGTVRLITVNSGFTSSIA